MINKGTEKMTTIEITPEIKEEILREIRKVDELIIKELSYSPDLRRYENIEKHMNYLKEMKTALQTGEL